MWLCESSIPGLFNRFKAPAKPSRVDCHFQNHAGTPEPPGVHGNTARLSYWSSWDTPLLRPAVFSPFSPPKGNYCQIGASAADKYWVRNEVMLLIHHAIDIKITILGNKIVITCLCFREERRLNMSLMQLGFFEELQVEFGGLLGNSSGCSPPHCAEKWWTSVNIRAVQYFIMSTEADMLLPSHPLHPLGTLIPPKPGYTVVPFLTATHRWNSWMSFCESPDF